MNDYKEETPYCYFHPREVVVGVCPLCLNERLLIVASKQQRMHSLPTSTLRGTTHSAFHGKPLISLPNFFALGSFLNRLELRHRKPDFSGDDASTSQEDSFISIKFEENGVASWEKSTVSKVTLESYNKSWNQTLSKEANDKETKSVIEHAKPRGSLRWRKRIGHLFQLIRWKRSNKGNVCHVGSKVEGVKVRRSWIRTLTKGRTKE